MVWGFVMCVICGCEKPGLRRAALLLVHVAYRPGHYQGEREQGEYDKTASRKPPDRRELDCTAHCTVASAISMTEL